MTDTDTAKSIVADFIEADARWRRREITVDEARRIGAEIKARIAALKAARKEKHHG